MPLVQGNLTIANTWQSSVPNPNGFGARGQGPDSLSFNLSQMNLTIFNQVYSGDVTIAPGSFVDINVTSLTNLNAETISFTRLMSLLLINNNLSSSSLGQVMLTNASSNPLGWPFGSGGASESITVMPGAPFLTTHGDISDTIGYVTGILHKTFRLLSIDAGTPTISVSIFGGTN